jgi:hypothetical protein
VRKSGQAENAPTVLLLRRLIWLFALVAPRLHAQSLSVSGRVLTADSTPVPTRVVLHRVAQETQGPIDSTSAGHDGRFRFRFHPDSGAFYILSAQYAGIEYFSQPVPSGGAGPVSGISIVVYDTSSSVPISLQARHLVVTRPGEDGSRSVLDIMVLRNDGRRTRIASDSTRPTWTAPLPVGSVGLELSESDFSREAVGRRGDSVIVVAPFAPGEKQLTVQYLIPARRTSVELPIGSRGVSLNVLAEEPQVSVSGRGVGFSDTQTIQGRTFRRWSGVAEQGTVIRLTLPGTGRTPGGLLAALVAAMALALAASGWFLIARPRAAVTAPPADLLDTLAALDLRYAGREDQTPADEWKSYVEERAKLKARLEASLAAGSKSQ